ncbi:agglutinin biogenesis protein MshN [Alteromonas mediterranea]|uniref:tetratricopeptide repeat protein n=1 Tax=Alteromonas mediterranea TaxID=314275 RepID=UPI000903D87E|nr:tetratricopeptide repeat protein [Alteromonas mediterranea]APD92715.1 agglutinin biogenesis protein MshN [Alteromonas mediterranea]APD96329.1 agglutinin biogenesis protein MshN [Alteromonas mediterranea]
MSILNDTLKSLDKRNQSEDFGLPPTVQLAQQPLWPKIFVGIAIIALLGWFVSSAVLNNRDDGTTVSSTEADKLAAQAPDSTLKTERVSSLSQTGKLAGSDEQAEGQTGITGLEANDEFEGMRSSPLSENDMALQNSPTDVAALVTNSIDETREDDEAQYRVGASDSRKDTPIETIPVKATPTESAPDEAAPTEAGAAETMLTETVLTETMLTETKSAETKSAETKSAEIISRPPVVEVAPKTPQQQSAVHLEAGLKAYNFGMYGEAQKSFTLALSTNPENDEARKQLAALYFGQNNSLQALQVLSEGVMLSPQSLTWRELMAKILMQESRFEEVLNLMPDSLDAKALAEGRADYLIIKGTSAQTINKPAQAVSAFSAMTSLQPNNAKWWLALGVNYDALADERLAISSYSRALAIGGLSSASAQYASSRLTELQEQP